MLAMPRHTFDPYLQYSKCLLSMCSFVLWPRMVCGLSDRLAFLKLCRSMQFRGSIPSKQCMFVVGKMVDYGAVLPYWIGLFDAPDFIHDGLCVGSDPLVACMGYGWFKKSRFVGECVYFLCDYRNSVKFILCSFDLIHC